MDDNNRNFGNFNLQESPWDSHINGEPKCFSTFNGASVWGVLRKIDKDNGYAYIMPSIVYDMKCSQASINNDSPTE
ncbi:MAG: hypothetical protein PHX96_06035 [Candidatus Nanoarchaeia archaeon]|nr:hypothetical protein [Candidatus Nanoarchaeia archaeon]